VSPMCIRDKTEVQNFPAHTNFGAAYLLWVVMEWAQGNHSFRASHQKRRLCATAKRKTQAPSLLLAYKLWSNDPPH